MGMRCVVGVAAAVLLLQEVPLSAGGAPPNFVFVLTDDQDMRLGLESGYTDWGSVAAQPAVERHLLRGGTAMTNFFVNTPICCPSRTEFFTGRYFHNVVAPDGEGCMGTNTSGVSNPNIGLFGRLTRMGYTTGIFGKVTNDQEQMLRDLVSNKSATYISAPISYNDYYGLDYFNYNASRGDVEGSIETLDETNPVYGTAYQTTQIGNRSLEWLEGVVSRKEFPFFMYVGPHAPHYPADPAPWYEGAFSGLKAPRTPNYNVESPDKAQHVRQNPPMSECLQCWEDQHFRDRWRTLLSVDDIVSEIFETLEGNGVLDNTYVFYTSDHGYKLGQWRIPTSKQHAYETDIRVPLFARGPGIPEGTLLPNISGNVDLLPTILRLAGAEVPPSEVDGKEFASLLLGAAAAQPRRTAWLNEFKTGSDSYSDHSKIWAPDNFTETCGGPLPTGPAGVVDHSLCVEQEGVGEGVCYFVNSHHSNNWRALRRLNATHNTQYLEVAASWSWATQPANHFEYYDVAADPYQMTNLYPTLGQGMRDTLAAELLEYFQCKGESCP